LLLVSPQCPLRRRAFSLTAFFYEVNPGVILVLSFAETGHNPKSFMKTEIEVLRDNYTMNDLNTEVAIQLAKI
jgi:hypothetical protein